MPMVWASEHSLRHSRNWGWILAYGLLLVAIGFIALFEPIATGLATGFFIAFVLFCAGVAALAAGFSLRGWHNRWLDILLGVLAIAVGFVAIWHPFFAAFSLVWFIGAWLLLSGISELVAGFRASSHRWPLILLGIVNIVLGLYLFFSGPFTALIALSVLVGFSFVLRGIMLCVLAMRVRSPAMA